MNQKDISTVVEKLVGPIAEELGLELVDVEFVKEGPNWYLRVFLDKEGGLEIEDCSIVSNTLSQLLDEADPIPQAYMLEVSSPGLDRPLKKEADFTKYAGRLVKLKTYAPLDGKKEFIGRLVGLEQQEVLVKVDDTVQRFPMDKLASVRLEIEF